MLFIRVVTAVDGPMLLVALPSVLVLLCSSTFIRWFSSDDDALPYHLLHVCFLAGHT